MTEPHAPAPVPPQSPARARASKLSFAVLGIRDFRLLLLTRMFVLMALQAQAVIVGWQIYSLTRNPFLLGLTGLVEAAPAIACALFAGHIVDNSVPQRIYLRSLGVLTLNTVMLFSVGSGIFNAGDHLFLSVIYGGVFVSGVARAFIMPSSFSLLAQIVPRKNIAAASAWMSTGMQTALIASPAIAGIIYGGYGALPAWLMPMSLTVIAATMMGFISAQPRPEQAAKREAALASIREGWKFIAKSPVLLSAMALDMLAVLFGGAVALLPAYAEEVLKVGAEGLGGLRAAPAIGAVGMALFLALKPMRVIRMTTLMWVVAGFGVCMIGFGLSHVFWLSMIFLAVSGAFDGVSVVIRSTLMQILTPDHMRGRVSSVNSMFIISSNEIGAFESGTLAKLIGLIPAVVAGGIGTLAVAGLTAWRSPGLRRTIITVDETGTQQKA